MELSLENIKELLSSLDGSSLGRLVVETDSFKLTLEKNAVPAVSASAAPAALNTAGIQSAQGGPVSPSGAAADKKGSEKPGAVVKSPIVGTFYASASPQNPPLVEIGQKVKKGDVLCIIESMKLMNEIASEFDGTLAEVFAKNGEAVEFGQPLFRIETQ